MLVLSRREAEVIWIEANGGTFSLTREVDDPNTGMVVLKLEGPELRLRLVGDHGDFVCFNIGPFDVRVDIISRRGCLAALGFTADKQRVRIWRDEADAAAA